MFCFFNYCTSDAKEIKEVYSLDKICKSNIDCSENELCDSLIGICICSNGFQLDDTKKFCSPIMGTMELGLNNSSYNVDEVNNVNLDQQQEQLQLDTLKKVKR